MMVMKQAMKGAEESPRAGERLQKILAQAGIASRRAAEQIILEGRVQVNGQTVTELGTKADLSRDHIRVDGKLLHGREPERYFLLNKPRGYVTTMDDPEGRPTVASLLAESAQKKVTGEHSKLPRLYPVGRLDYLSEGLLLMTNDGGLANRLSKASGGVQKTYLVKVSGKPSGEALEQLRFLPNKGARLLEQVLRSALGNAEDRGARDVDPSLRCSATSSTLTTTPSIS